MKQKNFANRGMGLETLIEYANEQYSRKGIATIQKVSTPWKVVRNGAQIVSAYPEKKSTVDFIGVYKKTAIAFDAKQTKNKTSFPLANVEEHQVKFMLEWEENGGIAFILIEFTEYQEIYYVPFQYFYSRWQNALRGTEKKSISYDWIMQLGKVKQAGGFVLDYLAHITEVAG